MASGRGDSTSFTWQARGNCVKGPEAGQPSIVSSPLLCCHCSFSTIYLSTLGSFTGRRGYRYCSCQVENGEKNKANTLQSRAVVKTIRLKDQKTERQNVN